MKQSEWKRKPNLRNHDIANMLPALPPPFSLKANIGAIFGRILDVYWLPEGENEKIWDPFIQSFESLDSLEIYARDLDDFQLAGMAKVVREYTRILPDAVYGMMKISKNSTENQNGKGIVLSTVHGAKGQEYDNVYINPDVAASLSRPGGPSVNAFGDEANIAYVAFTRVMLGLKGIISWSKKRL